MKLHLFDTEQWLPRNREEIFGFFSDAYNLQTLTPDWLQFVILTPLPITMRAGAIIDYRLKLRGIPVRWRTEITTWDPPQRFVDEQRRGPYRFWAHEHLFEQRDGGTLMADRVRYAVPGGWLVNGLFVRAEVRRIFDFRRRKLSELFPVG